MAITASIYKGPLDGVANCSQTLSVDICFFWAPGPSLHKASKSLNLHYV